MCWMFRGSFWRADQGRQRNEPGSSAARRLLWFSEKPSSARVSFSVAMTHLGGVLRPDEVGLGDREPINDIARAQRHV